MARKPTTDNYTSNISLTDIKYRHITKYISKQCA